MAGPGDQKSELLRRLVELTTQSSSSSASRRKIKRTLPFNFYLYLIEQENCIRLRKVARPQVQVVYQKGCFACEELIHFFVKEHADDGPIVEQIPCSDGAPHHEVLFEGRTLNLDAALTLPKQKPKKQKNEDADTRIRHRLKREFELKTQDKPLRHQQALIDHVRKTYDWTATKKEQDPFLVYWMMGAGKTKGILLALAANPWRKIVIVAPNTIIGYWAETIADLAWPGDTEFTIVGYTELMRLCVDDEKFLRDAVVILDEAHYYRNLQSNMRWMVQELVQAKALFLLTGTPLINDYLEVEYLACFFSRNESFREGKTTPEDLKRWLQGHVFWYDPAIHDAWLFKTAYPSKKIIVKKVAMQWLQTLEYLFCLRKSTKFGPYEIGTSGRNSYDSLSRRISNQMPKTTELSPKFEAVLQDISEACSNERKDFPIVVYSHYKALGACGLFALIQKKHPQLRLGLITGDTRERQKIITAYNSGKIDVLFITNAAHQGCDLLNTAQFFIVDPHTSQLDEDQTTNRVLRFGSHPKGDSVVIVRKYISIFPTHYTDTDRKQLQAYFAKRWLQNCELDASLDVMHELRKAIKGLQVVDERYEERMAKQHAMLLPWIQVIQQCSFFFEKIQSKNTRPTSEKKKQKKISEKQKSRKKSEEKKKEKQRKKSRKQDNVKSKISELCNKYADMVTKAKSNGNKNVKKEVINSNEKKKTPLAIAEQRTPSSLWQEKKTPLAKTELQTPSSLWKETLQPPQTLAVQIC